MRTTGLRIEGPVEEFTQALPASLPGEVSGPPRPRVPRAVKAHHTEAALEALAPYVALGGFVVSAQNGLNELTIAPGGSGRERTVGCFVKLRRGLARTGPHPLGQPRRRPPWASSTGGITDRVRAVHDLLRLVEPDAVLTENIWGYLWGKMGYGALLFAHGALARLHVRRDGPLRAPRRLRSTRPRGDDPRGGRGGAALGVQRLRPPTPSRAPTRPGWRPRSTRWSRHNRRTAKTHSGVWRDLAVRPTQDGGGRADRRDVRHGPRAGGCRCRRWTG